jgi:hypothetical protein
LEENWRRSLASLLRAKSCMSRYHERIDDGTGLYCFSAPQTAAGYGMEENVCESYR